MSEHTRWNLDRGRNRAAVQAGYDGEKRAIELGRAVRRLREEAEMTQAELATLAGTSQAAVSRLEAGEHMPTIGVLDRLAAALGAQVDIGFSAA